MVFVMNPTGTVVAVVCAEAMTAVTESAKAAAMERVQMDEYIIEGGGIWWFMLLFRKECKGKIEKFYFITRHRRKMMGRDLIIQSHPSVRD